MRNMYEDWKFFFLPEKPSSMKQTDLRHVQKGLRVSVCEPLWLCSDHSFPTLSTSSAMKTPESTEEDCVDPKSENE